jgi:prevent-host-death family protein
VRTVNIADLKAHLSAHLQHVQNGEEVIVCDRNRPVARITPVAFDNYSVQEQRLIARGVLTPPVQKRSVAIPEPSGKVVPDEIMKQIWQEEREGR